MKPIVPLLLMALLAVTGPGHRRNLLRPQARMAGIGHAAHNNQQVWVLIVAAENGESGGKQGIFNQFPCVSGLQDANLALTSAMRG
jgi:hypothetical protein